MQKQNMVYEIENRQDDFTAVRIKRLLPNPHIHFHVEFIYLTEGSSIATLDNKEYRFGAGECFIAFPNQIHYYHDVTPIKGFMVIFSPELFADYIELFCKMTPFFPIINVQQLSEEISGQLEKICARQKSGLPFHETVAKGLFMALLGEMFSLMEFQDNPTDQDAIKRILKYCVEHYTEPIDLEILSKELYLNKDYISHVFKKRMHMNYKDFVNKLRVEHASRLLKKGMRVTETAYESGFSSVRTFNRAFQKYMLMSPKEYNRSTKFIL